MAWKLKFPLAVSVSVLIGGAHLVAADASAEGTADPVPNTNLAAASSRVPQATPPSSKKKNAPAKESAAVSKAKKEEEKPAIIKSKDAPAAPASEPKEKDAPAPAPAADTPAKDSAATTTPAPAAAPAGKDGVSTAPNVPILPPASGPTPETGVNLDAAGPRLNPPGSQPPPIVPPLPEKPGIPAAESLLPGSEFMLIPNGIVPSPIPRLVPTPEVMGFRSESAAPAIEMLPPEQMTIPVTKFKIRYAPGQKAHKQLPTLEELQKATVVLARSGNTYTAPDPKAPAKSNVTVKVTDTNAKPVNYRGDALERVSQSVVGVVNKNGVYGVYVILDPAEIDRTKGKDYDQRKNKTELSLVVYVSEIAKTRTVRRRIAFRTTDKPVIDDPRDARVKSNSPVGGPSGTTLLDKPALQNYLSRLNRFPGRRVDAAINASGEERKVTLDYLIREEKPIFIYAQTSNTGTESTGEWRTRMGLDYKQLFRMDDVLRLEYITTDFSRYNAALFSYEFTPIFPDYLKFKTFGTYSKYSARDIGFDLQNFESTVWIGGEQITWTPTYIKGFPLDIFVGFQWMHVEVNNQTNLTTGVTDFALPYFGLGTERVTEKYTIQASAQVEYNMLSLANTKDDSLFALGRFNTDRRFAIGNWNLASSVFLEPLIFGKAWDEQKVWWKSTRAHELALSCRGQVAFDRARLAPELEMVAGGFDTVRGYPESLFAGDSVLLASAEYRFHVPRAFLKPQEAIEKDKEKKAERDAAANSVPPKPGSSVEPKFAMRPPSISSGPDWDLILRAFFDYGKTFNNEIIPASERNRRLASIGGGVELQLFKPLYISLRMDVGYVLIGQDELLTEPVDKGDVRFHFSGAIAW